MTFQSGTTLRDLDLTTLRLFVSVCETGNIARAGEQGQHRAARPSASAWRSSKHQVGTPLLVRKRHGVAPTAAGQTLLEHARAMLDSAARIERDMEATSPAARGQVRILASVSAMTESLADDVAAFLQMPAHRNIQVDLEERVSPEIVRGVREGLASLGVCWDAADLRRAAAPALPQRPPLRGGAARAIRWRARKSAALRADAGLRAREPAGQQRGAGACCSGTRRSSGARCNHRVVVTNFEAALARRARRPGHQPGAARGGADRTPQAYGLTLVPLAEPWAERRFIICLSRRAGAFAGGAAAGRSSRAAAPTP